MTTFRSLPQSVCPVFGTSVVPLQDAVQFSASPGVDLVLFPVHMVQFLKVPKYPALQTENVAKWTHGCIMYFIQAELLLMLQSTPSRLENL